MMTRINVALKPPDDVTTRLVSLAQDLLPAGRTLSRIGDLGSLPHLTLYMAEFQPQDVGAVQKRITAIAPDLTAAACDAQGISCTAGGYLEIAYAKSAALVRMQQVIARSVQDLALPVAMPAHVTPTADQRRNLEIYRYELMGDSFRPHVTLGRLVPYGSVTFHNQPFAALSFLPEDLSVAEADEHGAARRLLTLAAIGEDG